MGVGIPDVFSNVNFGRSPERSPCFQRDLLDVIAYAQSAPKVGQSQQHAVWVLVRLRFCPRRILVVQNSNPVVLENGLLIVGIGVSRV